MGRSKAGNLPAAEGFAKADATDSVISALRGHLQSSTEKYSEPKMKVKSGYDLDAERLTTPDNTADDVHYPKTSTLREVGMRGCENPFIQAMQAQAFVAWSSELSLNKKEDTTLYNMQTMGCGFHDSSYVVQTQKDGSYVLQMRTLSVVRYLTDVSQNSSIDSNGERKTLEKTSKEIKTRDFKEATSSYSSVKILFKKCEKSEFDDFVATDNGLKEKIGSYVSADGVYYKPEIISAEYKLYVAPRFEDYKVSNVEDANFDIGKTDITLASNQLDNRLEFISGSLADAMKANDLDDKQIEYALINLQELVNSPHVDKKELLEHRTFNNMLEDIRAKNLSESNKELLAEVSDGITAKISLHEVKESDTTGNYLTTKQGAALCCLFAVGFVVGLHISAAATFGGSLVVFGAAAYYYSRPGTKETDVAEKGTEERVDYDMRPEDSVTIDTGLDNYDEHKAMIKEHTQDLNENPPADSDGDSDSGPPSSL